MIDKDTGEYTVKQMHDGHRKRLRQQFKKNEFNGIDDENVLELLLFYAIPRKDTYMLSRNLIHRFGSLDRVFEASLEELTSVEGITENAACLIKMILPLYRRYNERANVLSQSFDTTEAIAKYLMGQYIGESRELVLMVCFDSKMRLINCCRVCEGSFSEVNVDLRKVAEIAIGQNASYAVLSHNHPHASANASRSDIVTTGEVVTLLRSIKVTLIDHIIVSPEGYFSFGDHRDCYPVLVYGNSYRGKGEAADKG